MPVFYPRAICPHCRSEELNWEQNAGCGHLSPHATIWKPGHPGWAPPAPYVIGLVELDEGPAMLSHIICQGRTPEVGKAVGFAPTFTGDWRLPCLQVAVF